MATRTIREQGDEAVSRYPDSCVGAIASRHPSVGMAVGVVTAGRPVYFEWHGLADIASPTPVNEEMVFRIGSITKTFTAIAVPQLADEQELIDLDAPADDYLHSYTLIRVKPEHRPPRVRQLLTHTAGLPQLVYPARAFQPVLGETVPYGQRAPTLAEFYRGRLHLITEPGSRHTYSNHGFATLGQMIEDVTGLPLAAYFREHIFGPLGMTDTEPTRSDRIRGRLATGYALRADGPRPVRDCDLVTVGAGAIYSTAGDMASYVAALLAGGSGKHGVILRPEIPCQHVRAALPARSSPAWGWARVLSPRCRRASRRRARWLVPGFISQLSLAPDDGIGVVAFTTGRREPWHGSVARSARSLGRTLGVADPVIRTVIRQQPATTNPRSWVAGALGAVATATTVNAVRRHRQYAPLRARGCALAAAAARRPARHPQPIDPR